MQKKVEKKAISRKHLADPALGIKYKTRLEKSNIKSQGSRFTCSYLGNGYGVIKKKK